MGWPLDWSLLKPLPKDEFHAWLEGFSGQDLRDMRQSVQSENDAEWPSSRCQTVSGADALQQNMRQQPQGITTKKLSLAGAQASEECMRSVRLHKEIGGPPLRPRPHKQQSIESANPVHSLSQLLARYGKKAWQDGSWENAVPRVITTLPFRVDRLKALGNGQVPRVAAAAWRLMVDGMRGNDG